MLLLTHERHEFVYLSDEPPLRWDAFTILEGPMREDIAGFDPVFLPLTVTNFKAAITEEMRASREIPASWTITDDQAKQLALDLEAYGGHLPAGVVCPIGPSYHDALCAGLVLIDGVDVRVALAAKPEP